MRRSWAPLLAGAVVTALATVAAGTRPVEARAVAAVTPPSASEAEAQLARLLDAERSRRGLAPLVRVQALDEAARTWATFMAGGGCAPSRLCNRPDLTALATSVAPRGWTKVAENVGRVPLGGTVASLHEAFLRNPSQLANMVSSDHNALGLGVALAADGSLFVTYEFLAMRGTPTTAGQPPLPGIPDPPAGLGPQDQLVFLINAVRAGKGLAPVVRHPVLDREATFWSAQMAAGGCARAWVCHRKDMSQVARAAVGTAVTGWAENVGTRIPANPLSQFLGFMDSAAHRANILRKDAVFVGIGYVLDRDGRAFTTMEFVSARKVGGVSPAIRPCGWITNTVNKNATGPFVRVAQCALAEAGFYDGPIDGVYGPSLVAAVKSFQAQRNLRVSGNLDTLTRNTLGVR